MAKDKKELDKELTRGAASFKGWGAVKIGEKTFGEVQTSKKSTFKYINVNLPVNIGEGRSLYVQMMGGYDPAKPILKRFGSSMEDGMLDIKWEHRLEEEIIKSVSQGSLISISLERDEDGKLIRKQFISEIDAAEYMKEHLEDGAEVYVGGEIEYSRYDGKIQRKFNVKTISRNEGYTKSDGEVVDPHPHGSEMRQTYLVDSTSVDKKFAKQLEAEGQTIIGAYVPQYVGKEDGKEIKKVLPLPQQIIVKADESNIELRKKAIEKFLKVTDKKVVREIVLKCDIVDGYTSAKGDVEITAELQELIDLGLMTEEEVVSESTVRGNRISELVFLSPAIVRKDDKPTVLSEDRYSADVLIIPELDDDDEDETTTDSETESAEEEVDGKGDSMDSLSDDELDDLFN